MKKEKPAKPSSMRKGRSSPKAPAVDARWTKLTWNDVNEWTGSTTVSRGRSYQRGGQVKDLRISSEGELLATVVGTEYYATTVALGTKGKVSTLESSCTCPVGFRCKHAVAVIADYLQAVAEKRDVPLADEDDPRWEDLEEERDDDWDEDEDEDEDSWDDDEEPPVPKARRSKAPAPRQTGAGNWDEKIEQHLRAKTQGELADLVWSLVRRFPEVYQEFRERITLQQGDVKKLVAEARREILKVTSESAWRDEWTGEGYTPDYSKVRHRLERLLELGHADEVVSLGRDFIADGLDQISEASDEGETSTAFAECLPVIFQALLRSSLSGPERLLFAIDAELDDDYDVTSEANEVVFDAPHTPEDWSTVADTLADRLRASHPGVGGVSDDFSRNYKRNHLSNWLATALENAGRGDEVRALYESEARITGSYQRLVTFLFEAKEFDALECWAREGINATSAKLPGIAAGLVKTLCELSQKRKQWDVIAAHAAIQFFTDYPNQSTFDELMQAARKARCEEPVRAAALRFLETGAMPYQVIRPQASAAPAQTTGRRSAPKKRSAAPAPAPKPEPGAPVHVKSEPDWPLPFPDFLLPLLSRPGRHESAPRPHLDVLLDMAIAAKRPDEVLHWFDAMQSAARNSRYRVGAFSDSDRVAEAVSAKYPERALAIYTAGLNGQLPRADPSAYQSATAYLRKMRPLYMALNRADEWTALVASIRAKYGNRPRFMEALDGLDDRPIVQTAARSRRK